MNACHATCGQHQSSPGNRHDTSLFLPHPTTDVGRGDSALEEMFDTLIVECVTERGDRSSKDCFARKKKEHLTGQSRHYSQGKRFHLRIDGLILRRMKIRELIRDSICF